MINKLIAYLKTLFGAKPKANDFEVMGHDIQTQYTYTMPKAAEMPSATAEKVAPVKKARKPRAKKSKN